MNAIEVIAERIEKHVEGVEATMEEIFNVEREAELEQMVSAKLYTGTVKRGVDDLAFTVYVFDNPFIEDGYTQVTVNFDLASFDPINYLYDYDSGEELRLTSN
jgi:hypothetical protein